MKILVIIPTHDRTEFIAKAIDSVMKQTRQADELVVVGNVTSKAHPDVTFVYSDSTLSVRLNEVIESSCCDAFIMLSDDDWLLPEYIYKTAKVMEGTGADIVYDGYGLIPVTSLVRKSIWKKVGGYCDIGFFDWDFNWSCQEAGAVTIPIRERMFIYNQHPTQVAQHTKWQADGTWDLWKSVILAKHPLKGKAPS
jgi:hypothetical protein